MTKLLLGDCIFLESGVREAFHNVISSATEFLAHAPDPKAFSEALRQFNRSVDKVYLHASRQVRVVDAEKGQSNTLLDEYARILID